MISSFPESFSTGTPSVPRYVFFAIFQRCHITECLAVRRGAYYGLPVIQLEHDATVSLFHLRQATQQFAELGGGSRHEPQLNLVDEYSGKWGFGTRGEHEAKFAIYEAPEIQVLARLGHGVFALADGLYTSPSLGRPDEGMQRLIEAFRQGRIARQPISAVAV